MTRKDDVKFIVKTEKWVMKAAVCSFLPDSIFVCFLAILLFTYLYPV